MEKLLLALLNDPHGICEEAYDAIVEHLENAGNQKLLAFVRQADAVDGRFYFASNG